MQQRRRSSQPQQEYVVRSGDNPYVIAKSNGVALQRLLEANGLNQNSIIHPGDVLQIPGQGGAQAAQPQQRPQSILFVQEIRSGGFPIVLESS